MTNQPNILFLTHRVPYPPNRGDRIRSYHTLRFLSERANIHLGSLTDEPVPDETHRQLDGLCRRFHIEPLARLGRWINGARALLSGRSATEGMFASRGLQRVIQNWSRETNFDAVFVFCSSMEQFTRIESLRDARLVVDLVDVDSEKWLNYAESAGIGKRQLYGLEARRVRRLETAIAQRAHAVTLVSEDEAAVLRRFCDADNIHAISNGVDLEYFHPQRVDSCQLSVVKDLQPTPVNCQLSTDNFSLVFVGVLDYRANIEGLRWFCREVWPKLRRQLPHAELTIVGRRPGEAARKLAETDGVHLAGEVSDVRPFVWNVDVVIAPLTIARGIQNKVLEAMAMGKPVLATPQAVEGTDAIAGEHLLAPSTPDDWIVALTELSENPDRRSQLAAAGRRLIETYYHWPVRLKSLETLLGMPTHTDTENDDAPQNTAEVSLTA